jgi:magnesium chelatase family protein
LLDRIDLHVEVLRPSTATLRDGDEAAEPSAVIAARVERARAVQLDRAGVPNGRLEGSALKKVCAVEDDCWALLECAADRFNLSARAHQRILRVARTIGDLAADKKIAPPHVAEALSLRCLDRR